MTPERGVSLAPHTSLRVGGPADFFVLARSAREMAEALRWATEAGVEARVIGGGSNLLVAEAGAAGLVIKTAFARASVEHRGCERVLVAEAGANLANVARRLAKQDLGGLEWAANVPGTVGGAAVNNAGAFGGDTASSVLAVTVVDRTGTRTRLGVEELRYAYRTSALKRRELREVAVESVDWRLTTRPPGEADARVKELNAQRMRTQPRILSAGSVFANPEGGYSGKLIEEAGLKGAASGDAQISEQHANFIVNFGHATPRDVYSLMRRAQNTVFEQAGIWLRAEIELFGRWTEQERATLAGPLARAHG
ncbi:MAG: UDP-N-acetylmuramate dehydrogenase [Chloroflexi bacterium]|nr:UDP-N-acetylmuramate dehydrogenase [Chloroflexota bacterium]MBV9597690.1 UDP-N-acetylmuramate dehydrogenase [Chloroflexota bacterium]